MPVGVTALLIAAVAGTLVSVIGYVGLCNGDSSACPEGDPDPELVWQLVLALVGLPVAAAMAWAAARERRRIASAMLAVALALYAGWAVLLDIATHGGRFTLLPELILLAIVAAGVAAIRRSRHRRGRRPS